MINLLFGLAQAQMLNPFGESFHCDAIWGTKAIPFPTHQAKVQVNIRPLSESGSLSLAIFRYEDKRYFIERNSATLCDYARFQQGGCTTKDLGKFMLRNKTGDAFVGPFLNEPIHWHSDFDGEKPSGIQSIHDTPRTNLTFNLNVDEDGLYCVLLVDDPADIGQDYELGIHVTNPYGRLPAIFFPAFPFFATSFAVYTLIGLVWAVVSFMNRKELLPIQNLIGGLIFFLMLENAVNMGFFIDFNNHGYVSKGFLAAMVTLNAARNSFSFFMVLVVSLGYGVVYPTLGKQMWGCLALAVVHFAFGALYFTSSMVIRDVNSIFVFLLGLPLALSLMGFYIWTLVGITNTIKYLESKRQTVKLEMYEKLSVILTASVILLATIFVANSINIGFRHNPFWIANQWKWRWLLLDGALNINYFLAFVSIAYIWMPTTNNARLGLMQLDSDDMEDPRDFVELESPHDDEHVLEWAEQHVKEPGAVHYSTEKLMQEELEELN